MCVYICLYTGMNGLLNATLHGMQYSQFICTCVYM